MIPADISHARDQIRKIETEIEELEKKRYACAAELDFEGAMQCLDEKTNLKEELFCLIMHHCL